MGEMANCLFIKDKIVKRQFCMIHSCAQRGSLFNLSVFKIEAVQLIFRYKSSFSSNFLQTSNFFRQNLKNLLY